MKHLSARQLCFLLEAFLELDKSSPVFPFPEKATMNIAQTLDFFLDKSNQKQKYGDEGEYENLLARIIAFRYYILSLATSSEKGPEFVLLTSLFAQISNTTFAIIKLAEEGLDYQANALIRNLLELFMMLIVVTENPEKRLAAVKAHTPEESRNVWHQFFNKTQFIKMIDRYSEEFQYLVDEPKQWINDMYQELSSFVHNDFVNILCYSHSIADKQDLIHRNLWGEYVTRRGDIFNRLAEAIAPADLIFCAMLRDPKIDLNIYGLCDSQDKESLEVCFELNTLSDICMLLYATISGRKEVKEHIPVPLCKMMRPDERECVD